MINLILFLNPLRYHFEPKPMCNRNDGCDQFIGIMIKDLSIFKPDNGIFLK